MGQRADSIRSYGLLAVGAVVVLLLALLAAAQMPTGGAAAALSNEARAEIGLLLVAPADKPAGATGAPCMTEYLTASGATARMAVLVAGATPNQATATLPVDEAGGTGLACYGQAGVDRD